MIAAAALAFALVGVPPLPPFPSEVRPKDGTTAPRNARIIALGDPAPAPQTVGFAVFFDGSAATVDHVDAVGCCALVATLASEPDEGQIVTVNLTSPNGDVDFSFTAGPDDTTPPTFLQNPLVIDHSSVDANREDLVIGVSPSDDTQIGFVKAVAAGAVVGVSADGFVLRALAPFSDGQACVDVVSIDVAGNEFTSPAQACVDEDGEVDAGPGGDGGGGAECEGPGDMPVNIPSTSAVLALLAVLAARRRR
jgi:hypothetical protein